jgi:YfiH family protein
LPAANGAALILPEPKSGFHWSSEPWGHALRCRRLTAVTQHLFTSKQLALPAPEAWQAATESLDATPDRLMRVKQVHGNRVRVLKKGQLPADASEQRPDGDAIISNQPGLVLAVMVADCVPILLADPRTGAAAAIHAGWRGTCARVARTAIDLMRDEFGTDPADLVAAIGPSVGGDDYEVGDALIEAFEQAGHDRAGINRWFTRPGGKLHLDLWAANVDQLIDAGVAAADIFLCGLSTVSHPEIFESYRVAGDKAGRMAGLIVVPEAV